VFELGEAPAGVGLAPAIAIVEADGTFVAAQGEEGNRFEIKTGVFYSGKDHAGGRRHRRFKLLNKGCYATTADQDGFGRGLAARGFAWIGLHKARHVLCVHDGLDEYGQTFSDWFPHAVHQIDHFHVAERLWQVSGADAAVFEELKRLAFADPMACASKLRRSVHLNAALAREAAGYLEGVARDLHGVERIPRRLRRGRMRVVGSGVVEKGPAGEATDEGKGHALDTAGRRPSARAAGPPVLRPVADRVGGDRRLTSAQHAAPRFLEASVPTPRTTEGQKVRASQESTPRTQLRKLERLASRRLMSKREPRALTRLDAERQLTTRRGHLATRT
jgi:hypothetical protein